MENRATAQELLHTIDSLFDFDLKNIHKKNKRKISVELEK
jgi:hypothetical protein